MVGWVGELTAVGVVVCVGSEARQGSEGDAVLERDGANLDWGEQGARHSSVERQEEN